MIKTLIFCSSYMCAIERKIGAGDETADTGYNLMNGDNRRPYIGGVYQML
jgi:hypothetical protein